MIVRCYIMQVNRDRSLPDLSLLCHLKQKITEKSVRDFLICTFVRTDKGLEAKNLKYCGKYFLSPSASVYTAMHTSLNCKQSRFLIRFLDFSTIPTNPNSTLSSWRLHVLLLHHSSSAPLLILPHTNILIKLIHNNWVRIPIGNKTLSPIHGPYSTPQMQSKLAYRAK